MFFEVANNGKNEWWRYLLGLFAVILGYFIGQFPMMLAINRSVQENPQLNQDDINEFYSNPDFGVFDINPNMGFVLMLAMFVFAFLAFFGVFRILHGRKFRTLITWQTNLDWKKIFFGFFLWLILGLLAEFYLYYQTPELYTFSFRWENFIPLVLLSLIVLPIQTSTEELVFRGYLMQGIGLVARNKWVPLLITTFLFAFIHTANPEIEKYGLVIMLIYYLTAGLLLGIVTIMDDSLELALGIHAATNFIGAVFVGYEGAALNTESLATVKEIDPMQITVIVFVLSIIFLIVCSRIYGWGSFNKLFENIDYEQKEIV